MEVCEDDHHAATGDLYHGAFKATPVSEGTTGPVDDDRSGVLVVELRARGVPDRSVGELLEPVGGAGLVAIDASEVEEGGTAVSGQVCLGCQRVAHRQTRPTDGHGYRDVCSAAGGAATAPPGWASSEAVAAARTAAVEIMLRRGIIGLHEDCGGVKATLARWPGQGGPVSGQLGGLARVSKTELIEPRGPWRTLEQVGTATLE